MGHGLSKIQQGSTKLNLEGLTFLLTHCRTHHSNWTQLAWENWHVGIDILYLKLPNCQLLVHVSRKFVKPYKAWFGLLFFPSRRARGCLQLRFASAKMCQRYTMVYHIDPHCMCGILWYAGMPRKSGNKRVWMGFGGNAATEVTALDWGLCYWNVKALMFLCDPELAMNLMSETVKNGLPEELGVQTLLWKRAPQVKGRASCRALPSGRKDHHGSLSWMLCFLGNNQ